MRCFHPGRVLCAGVVLLVMNSWVAAASFVAFESGHVRPLALSPDGTRLFAVNTPDNRLEIFTVDAAGLTLIDSVPVGLEPVAVAARNNSEVWVVNHLSDSVSIVDVAASPPRVVRTLLVGDEPRDIVFAGPGGDRAFITAAHRGQNSPYTDPTNPGQLITPGIGRADVWVFNANSLGSSFGGTPLNIVNLFGDTPRSLAVSPDGSTVYAGVFHSGNRSTVMHEGAVCDGGAAAGSCATGDTTAPGGLPAPNVDSDNKVQPEVGLIVRHDGSGWKDESGRNWDSLVRFNLPDKDVFAIDANASIPFEIDAFSGVGTILYNMAVRPTTGELFVANTEAFNEVRFEGTRATNDPTSSVIGRQHETRITMINPGNGSVTPRHLNNHIDYSVSPAPAGVAQKSLALPRQVAFSADGNTLFLAAKGSDKVGILSVAALASGSFVPSSADHVHVAGGGPAGLVVDDARGRLYVTTRFDNGISIIDVASKLELDHLQLHNPEPQAILTGRRFLYDANLTSSNGEAACGSCHVDGDLDSLGWDLGDPTGSIVANPLDFTIAAGDNPPLVYQSFHPMKGPMTTQTLRGMDTHGPMHWRGDRFNGDGSPNAQPDSGVYNETEAFKAFAGAFQGLLGRDVPGTGTEMQAFADFILQVTMPPNPIRNLDDSLTTMQANGRAFYMDPTEISDGAFECNGCHTLDTANGFFGADGKGSFELEPQHLKIPHLRNMYQKVGMFGLADFPNYFNSGNNGHQGDQIRGFGFVHDGSVDTLLRFFNTSITSPFFSGGFTFPGGDPQRREVEQFMLAFDTNMKPVVGQQITLSDTNSGSVNPRIDLLVARAQAGDADLVVKGVVSGESRGWHRKSDGNFESDKVADAVLTDAALRALAQVPGQKLTYLAVPPGSGSRIGIDRDEDTVLDGDDNCPAVDNLSQLDTDSDGVGNACDTDDDNDGLTDDFEASIGTNSLLVDSDGDSLSDGDEVGYDGNYAQYTVGQDLNPLSDDTDGDGLLDAVDPIPLTVNLGDGDMTADSNLNTGDLLVTMQVVLGLLTTTDTHLAHGDLYPAGAPDGKITIRDLILLQKLVLP